MLVRHRIGPESGPDDRCKDPDVSDRLDHNGEECGHLHQGGRRGYDHGQLVPHESSTIAKSVDLETCQDQGCWMVGLCWDASGGQNLGPQEGVLP